MRQEEVCCDESGYLDIFSRYRHCFCPGKIIFLRGSMGTGKTTFVRKVCDELVVDDLVSSPSFALLNVYNTSAFRIAHLDLFRLDAAHQLEDIGALDFLDKHTLVFVEWPDNCAGFFPQADLDITFDFAAEDGLRRVVIREAS